MLTETLLNFHPGREKAAEWSEKRNKSLKKIQNSCRSESKNDQMNIDRLVKQSYASLNSIFLNVNNDS